MQIEVGEKKEKNRFFAIHLGLERKEKWFAYCKQLGKKPGTLINELIDVHLSKFEHPASDLKSMKEPQPITSPDQKIIESVSKIKPKIQLPEKPDLGIKSRIEIRLAPTEKALLDELAEKEQCSIQFWIINVIRAVLTRQPQIGGREADLLGESNYQLLAIGRNLNQIAKHLNNPENRATEKPTFDEIHQIRSIIYRHAKTVNQLIRACIERWSLG